VNGGGGENIKFVKKGRIAKSQENEPLLVDEKKNAYRVNDTILAIWNLCDGNRTQEQIVDELANETKMDKTKISGIISDILPKLERVGLVKKL
jgi:hypothetical protein